LTVVHWLDAVAPPLESHLKQLVETAHEYLFGDRMRPPEPQSAPVTESDRYDVFMVVLMMGGALGLAWPGIRRFIFR
jgi:hypothetical protein